MCNSLLGVHQSQGWERWMSERGWAWPKSSVDEQPNWWGPGLSSGEEEWQQMSETRGSTAYRKVPGAKSFWNLS